MKPLSVLELYSGIGGMHWALKESHPSAEVVAAYDINPVANTVYKYNFPEANVSEKAIDGLSAEKLNKLKFNMILMSPPCQPFTRIGLKKDIEDPRTKSFLHFLSILPDLKPLPDYILIENVKGFETSHVFERLCEALDACKYNHQGFLLSPKHFGIPNSRMRYYLLAKLGTFHQSVMHENSLIWEHLPINSASVLGNVSFEPRERQMKLKSCELKYEEDCQKIEEFLEENFNDEYAVPKEVQKRYLGVVDITTPQSTNSICFTKSYCQYVEGTGSMLSLNKDHVVTEGNSSDRHLRYFTPREVANLMSFPKDFGFPDSVTKKQRYKLLGNSLNVKVVAYLIRLMTIEPE